MENLKDIVESLLFVSEDPVTVDALRQVLAPVEPKAIRAVLDELAGEYQARGGGFCLAQVAGGYQLRSRPEHAEWIRKMVQPNAPRLSKAALETLAIIAYKQPVIRSDIENIRGVDSGGVLRMLLERKLVRVLGRKEIPGRPLIYATTKLFLQVFDLKDLKDLPSPKEIEAMGAEAESDKGPEAPPGPATKGWPGPENAGASPKPEDAGASPEPEDAGASPGPEDAGASPEPENAGASPGPEDAKASPGPGGTGALPETEKIPAWPETGIGPGGRPASPDSGPAPVGTRDPEGTGITAEPAPGKSAETTDASRLFQGDGSASGPPETELPETSANNTPDTGKNP